MDQLDLRLPIARLDNLVDRLGLTASPAGITRVFLRRSGGPPSKVTGSIAHLLDRARKELAEYLVGERTFFAVPADLSRLSPFDRAALEAAARIPFGETRSYKWVAERLGRPDATRAVGGAMAGNPVPLIVPCHRVVRTDGGLGGYSFGLARKEALLCLERAVIPYVGCVSTRIFCRKGCPCERAIRPDDRIHFRAAADAAADGYRPCSGCRPASP